MQKGHSNVELLPMTSHYYQSTMTQAVRLVRTLDPSTE